MARSRVIKETVVTAAVQESSEDQEDLLAGVTDPVSHFWFEINMLGIDLLNSLKYPLGTSHSVRTRNYVYATGVHDPREPSRRRRRRPGFIRMHRKHGAALYWCLCLAYVNAALSFRTAFPVGDNASSRTSRRKRMKSWRNWWRSLQMRLTCCGLLVNYFDALKFIFCFHSSFSIAILLLIHVRSFAGSRRETTKRSSCWKPSACLFNSRSMS